MMFDAEGDLWAVSNFTVGFQAQDPFWQGHVAEFAPNGTPISPMTTGFYGGGMEGGTFGAAIDAAGNFWADSYGGQSISVFDKHGKPLTPPEGITFNHQLGLMQGIIVMPNSDVWVLGISKNQLVYFPKGDWTKGRIVCEGKTAAPCSDMAGPFHLAVDQQNRIWVGNAFGDTVLRFPASDPSKVETFKTGGFSESGMNIDSQGNVWVSNRITDSPQGMAAVQNIMKATKASTSYTDWPLVSEMAAGTTGGGSMTLFRPDGTQAPGSPFSGPSLPGPWAVAVDGDDQVWISNFAAPWGQLAHLCGARTETCPAGMKTGDPISPPLGYVGGMQLLVDVDIDPAGDVWVGNNWQDYKQCWGTPTEALSTRCGGQGVVVFYGMAKPVRTPQIGPVRAP
jgi:sugar lactone lactonase YvrE